MTGNGNNMDIALNNILKKIGEHVGGLSDAKTRPVPFVREVHRQWKADGGKAAGKPRHSDRCLENFLREQGTPVKSLTPKLVEKTNIQAKDASALIRVFLSKWPEPGDSEGEIVYKPFLSKEEILEVANYIEERIENSDLPSPNLISQQESPPLFPGDDIGAVITRFFEEADALITVSPEHTLIVQPKSELIGFRNLMNAFMAIERRDNKPRPLIWVLDLGDQIFEDLDARRKFLNVQALMSRFKALKRFEDRGSEKRWQWLESRAAIVLLDTVESPEATNKSFTGLNRPVRPPFLAHNISLTSVAPDWLSSNEFRALYGRELEQVHQRSFSVFFNAQSEWESATKWPETSDLRYCGYASFESGKGETVGRGVELPPLSYRYELGFRAVAVAAAHALQLELQTPGDTISGEEATGQLQYLGFRVLHLEEFLDNY